VMDWKRPFWRRFVSRISRQQSAIKQQIHNIIYRLECRERSCSKKKLKKRPP
jgi:hypothetical protein